MAVLEILLVRYFIAGASLLRCDKPTIRILIFLFLVE